MTLFPNKVRIIDGTCRFNIELGAINDETSSSGLNSEYGSYPGGMSSPTIPLRAVKNNMC